jgi:hypothetical protein
MTTEITTTTRRCVGSTRFGIEAHEAPADDFPVQPSQKDGPRRMCKPHWRQYTNALRKAAVARKATEEDTVPKETPVAEDAEASPQVDPAVAEPETSPARRTRRAKVDAGPEAEGAEGAAA